MNNISLYTYSIVLSISEADSLELLKERLLIISELMSHFKEEISEVKTANLKIKGLYEIQISICNIFINAALEFNETENIAILDQLKEVDEKFNEFLILKEEYETEEGADELFSNITFNRELKDSYADTITNIIQKAELLLILSINVEDEEDIYYITEILERLEAAGRLDEFLKSLENELINYPDSITILYTLSDIYKRKDMVEEEYNTIMSLEEFANNTPDARFSYNFIYDRREYIESEYDISKFLQLGSIRVTTAPEGASIYINRIYKGTSPITFKFCIL